LYIYIIRFIIKAKPLFKTCLTFRISTLWVLYKTISDRSFSFIEVWMSTWTNTLMFLLWKLSWFLFQCTWLLTRVCVLYPSLQVTSVRVNYN